MPLLYGEADKAFLRLQEEILKTSEDQSIFAWGFEHEQAYDLPQLTDSLSSFFFYRDKFEEAKREICSNPAFALGSEKQIARLGGDRFMNGEFPILAPQPLFFVDAGDYVYASLEEAGEPCTITSRGVRLDSTIVSKAGHIEFMMLDCQKRGIPNYRAIILIVKVGRSHARLGCYTPFLFDAFRNSDIQTPRNLQIRYFHTSKIRSRPSIQNLAIKPALIIRRTPPLETGWRIIAFHPQERWDIERRVLRDFKRDDDDNIYVSLHNMRSNKYLDIEFKRTRYFAQYEMREPSDKRSTDYIDAVQQPIIVLGSKAGQMLADYSCYGYIFDIGCRNDT